MSLFTTLVRRALPLVPKSVIWTVARRYVAGASLEDALARVRTVKADGFGSILDILGEGVGTREGAREAVAEYHRALEALPAVDEDATISVKPTHLGLLLDPDLCAELLGELCAAAASHGRRVRFEMEDAPTIDGTLDVFRRVRREHPNVGCVLQARLFRTAADVDALLADGPGLDVRLVKGIYLEPPEIAWTEPADISRSYAELADRLLAGGATLGLATHDTALADTCIGLLEKHGRLARADAPAGGGAGDDPGYEFQLLMGVRLDEARRLRDDGHPVRIYVPYGKDWHAYTQRRLAHNPEIARHVTRAFFGLK